MPPLRAPFRLRNILPKAVNLSSTCFEFLQKASGERFKLLKALPCPTHLQALMEDSIIATEYCAFCRGPFPLQRLPGFDAWQSNVRAGRLPSIIYQITLLIFLEVLCLGPNDNESIDLTEIFRLPDIDDDIDVSLTGHPRTLTISRDPRSSRRRSDRSAFCFHAWCYSILKLKWKECHKLAIFKLARTLTPDPALWENACERLHDLDSINRFRVLANNESQPLLLSGLPLELRTYIWRYIGLLTPYSVFCLLDETARLARNLHCPSIRLITLQRGSRLSAKMISAFGTEYIQDLIMDQDCEGDNIDGDPTEVKYVSSLGGICAIRVLGIDWETGWIGKIPGVDCVWHGMIRVPNFQCDYNVR